MKYSHIVIKDGVWYPAGTEVPTGETMEEKYENEEVADEQSNEENVDDFESAEEPEKPKRGRKPKE